MRSRTARVVLTALIVLVIPAATLAADIGYRGFGPRVGVSSDPDQVVGGIHFDFGEFAKNVRLQPSVEVGFGDDTTTFQANFMVAYYFPVKAEVRKTREIYRVQGVQVHLDTVAGLGKFLEFEKVLTDESEREAGREALDSLRRYFQIADEDLMASSYSDFFEPR